MEWLVVAVLATLCMAAATWSNAFERADNLVYDRLIRFQGAPADGRIIIVAIDDESIARIGRFPWPRTIHAQFLTRLAAAHPKAIIYDVLFVDPSSGDQELAKAVSLARPILPAFMEVPGRNGAPVSVDQPLPELRTAGALIGQANVSPDDDGIVRRAHLAEGADGRLWPHVAALAACEVSGLACIKPQVELSGYVRGEPYLIPFAGRRQHFRTVPFSAVLDGSVPDQFFNNRIVLVGATAAGLSDAYGTPMAERDALMPGVEVNANVLQGLLTGRVLSPAPLGLRYIFALVPLWVLLAGFLLARPRFNFFLGMSLALAVVAASAIAFLEGHLWISPITSLAGLLLVYPFWAWRRLEATSAFMRRELERFHRDPDVFPSEQRPVLEPVQSDIELLGQAVGRARDLQRVVGDTLKALPDASVVIDATDGSIQFLNDRGHDLLGDADGRHFSWIVERLAKNRQLSGAAAPGPEALPAQITDGEDRIFDVRWSPIHTHEGNLVSWVVRLADVTALQIANRQREEALQLLTHDMRSPQASIIAALSQSPGALEQKLAQRIEAYARRTLDLADGFVQLARAEAQPLHLQEINLVDALVDAVDDLWPLSSTKQIKVEIDATDAELLVLGDRGLVTRALINLVGNAIKYSPPGSSVRCGVELGQSSVSIGVCDQGPGLTQEQVATLFNPFEQGGKSIDGAGLGLAFVRSVATRHGGTISFKNNPGAGCCFELELPLATLT